MEHIKKQININLNKRGLNRVAEASYVCYLFEQFKDKLLGKNISSKAISFKQGVLKIKTTDSVSASEVRFRGETIKKEINNKIGKNIVLKVDARAQQ